MTKVIIQNFPEPEIWPKNPVPLRTFQEAWGPSLNKLTNGKYPGENIKHNMHLILNLIKCSKTSLSALTLLVGQQEGKSSSATTIPKSLLLGIGLTWSNLTWTNSGKTGRLNKNCVRVCACVNAQKQNTF